MPVYEYYCEHCNGIYEQLRPMREATEPWPCPECNREGQRIMPTSFNAFTFRDGYPRRIPDKGTFWHFGKEVKAPVSGPVKPNEHPEINKPTPPPAKTKGELHDEAERNRLAAIQKEYEEKERQARIVEWEAKQANKKPEVPPLGV
jgi:putative FmdB family regulatory protein